MRVKMFGTLQILIFGENKEDMKMPKKIAK